MATRGIRSVTDSALRNAIVEGVAQVVEQGDPESEEDDSYGTLELLPSAQTLEARKLVWQKDMQEQAERMQAIRLQKCHERLCAWATLADAHCSMRKSAVLTSHQMSQIALPPNQTPTLSGSLWTPFNTTMDGAN